MKLRKFQRDFIRNATRREITTAALSIARGNGKSTLAGYLCARIMTPNDPLFRPRTESVIVASSLEQGRTVYKAARDILRESLGLDALGDDADLDGDDLGPDYRVSDSLTKIRIQHKRTKTSVQVRGANARNLMGLVKCPWVICDEPGAWKVTDGQLMWDAIDTAHGKPGSPLTAILIGTIAPAHDGWWPELIASGSHGSRYVQSIQADRESWDMWPTIKKANPLMSTFPESRATLLEERDEGRKDTRLKARFLSFRLNIPTADESEMLLTVEDFDLVNARPVGIPTGQPIVGVDLGGGRSWSAAVAIWPSGRVEALAVAPGLPDLDAQEKRDRVPSGLYQDLHQRGLLTVAEGLRVQPPAALWENILDRWGMPWGIVCDHFRLPELLDAIKGRCGWESRRLRWSEWSEDIRALRRIAKDGPLSMTEDSRLLIAASLSVALVKNDGQGNVRLVKRDRNNTSRDDVAAALTLAAGAAGRYWRLGQEVEEEPVALTNFLFG